MYYELSIATRTRRNVKSDENIQFRSLHSALKCAMFATKANMNKLFRITVTEFNPNQPGYKRNYYYASNCA